MLSSVWSREAIRKAKTAIDSSSSPVVVHIFSNGGNMLYHRLFDSHPSLHTRVRAAIFDSTPGSLNFASGFGAIYANSSRPLLLVTVPLVLYLLVVLVRLFRRKPLSTSIASALLVSFSWKNDRSYFERCLSDSLAAPSLYLYSKSDRLVDYQVVERLIAGRRKRDQAVVCAKCWEDSPHVAHCKTYPGEYRAAVEGLLRSSPGVRT
eukprot:gnl/TRDRNA2_/TRDRNA2_93215_c0_seq2.p1 gnl/TRDRNA2_/TRDRNA2_93215_c0~~gnl/TRDRNA2_/TRDRNA2_93215_c0_seq2.p1  ORF type:complete len:207 (+),score=23.76 gnl/TRDRNA2_/TRDRNA2_93215_c0_seq2:151-771(+)